MQIVNTFFQTTGQFGPQFIIEATGIIPKPADAANEPVSRITVPIVAIPDRRRREKIPPCSETEVEWKVDVEYTEFVQEFDADGNVVGVEAIVHPVGREMRPHKWCTCGECACCTQVLEVILAEHFVRWNPDKLHLLDYKTAKRLVQLGGVPGKRWSTQAQRIMDDTQPIETFPRAVDLHITGTLVNAVPES